MDHVLIDLIAGFAVIAAIFFAMVVLIQRRQTRAAQELVLRLQRQKQAVLDLVDKLGARMTNRIELNETFDFITNYVVKATSAGSGAIYLLNSPNTHLYPVHVVGEFPPIFPGTAGVEGQMRSAWHKVTPGGLAARALESGSVQFPNPDGLPEAPPEAKGVKSFIVCALVARGRVFGLLAVANKKGGGAFDHADTTMLQALADQAAITSDLVRLYEIAARQQKLDQEIFAAREFQRQLLPQELPHIEGFELGALNEPAQVVSGDFYDFIRIDPDHLGIVVADVSGKGIPAALIMAAARSHMRAEARGCLSPKETLARVNELLLGETKDEVYVTATYAILNLRTRVLRMVSAGHEPALLLTGGPESEVRRLKPDGMAVGLLPADLFESGTQELEITLEPGQTVLFYTDGLIEAVDHDEHEYGRERLRRELAGLADLDPDALVHHLVSDVQVFSHGRPQHDDITLLALRVTPPAVDGESEELCAASASGAYDPGI